ncbi:hypothetical protein NC653_025277 [Populus alba x Populus x berolinensis]|uniref:Uncharacterized protein n=1 Tax=Populus alba x Populus x berolinensis TaxID=444605 RepID=A0AAD6MB56_9ROSI|nr:hypothetical protein NC653_025271 [Populus alba x Populus x berolinensis]KAJ6982114.1 hypothetical protein NC653_025277 [Populus alba x Populus x berolinensis]
MNSWAVRRASFSSIKNQTHKVQPIFLIREGTTREQESRLFSPSTTTGHNILNNGHCKRVFFPKTPHQVQLKFSGKWSMEDYNVSIHDKYWRIQKKLNLKLSRSASKGLLFCQF